MIPSQLDSSRFNGKLFRVQERGCKCSGINGDMLSHGSRDKEIGVTNSEYVFFAGTVASGRFEGELDT
jgi:hypothetical protein